MMHPLTWRRQQRHSHKIAAKALYASDTDLRQPIQDVMTRIIIQWQDQFGHWQRFQEKPNQADAYRTAAARARSTGRRHRLVEERGQMLDVV
jgi:hypothetical protein